MHLKRDLTCQNSGLLLGRFLDTGYNLPEWKEGRFSDHIGVPSYPGMPGKAVLFRAF